VEEGKKKKILDFEQDVLWWEGEKIRFQIWGRMDVLLGEGNLISDFGKDVLLGEGKKTKF
jgi:hypothetical protein